MKKKIAVVLSGCGVYDGSEIHEATLTLYAIDRNGAEYQIFAPDIEQHDVVNHLTGKNMNETRNVLVEAARIARGNILALNTFDAKNYDAIIFPGGLGAAKNLCTYALNGINCTVNTEVADAIKSMAKLKKPIGALCISPVIIAKVLANVELTIGNDANTANDVSQMGATHKNTVNGEVAVDIKNRIVTNPCYMLNASIAQIGEGADNVVKSILKLIDNYY
ncbi:MAG: isoprenoid biosynthesis glyoxalase ElbB [Bacteroidetes bacterium]|nr:isoprenoid biosynthesis glyoxalase ElbB [Bacteroidota bacterium]